MGLATNRITVQTIIDSINNNRELYDFSDLNENVLSCGGRYEQLLNDFATPINKKDTIPIGSTLIGKNNHIIGVTKIEYIPGHKNIITNNGIVPFTDVVKLIIYVDPDLLDFKKPFFRKLNQSHSSPFYSYRTERSGFG